MKRTTDKERLIWFSRNPQVIFHAGITWYRRDFNSTAVYYHNTIRQAIDAAMKAERKSNGRA